MHIILVRKNFVKNCYTYIAQSIVVPGVFISLLMLGSVPYAAYHYSGQVKSTFSLPQTTYTASKKKRTAQKEAKALALRLERLQMENARLNHMNRKLKNQQTVKNNHFSLAWDDVIKSDLGEEEKSEKTYKSGRKLLDDAKQIHKKEKFLVSEDLLLKYHKKDKILPQGWPARQGRITSHFGWRGRRMHKGLDIAADANTDVLAVEDGRIIRSTTMRGYGKIVEIQHSDTYSTRYAHNNKNLVKVGDKVKKGQVIALVGATGRATGNHIHFEVREAGKAIDPLKYFSVMEHIQLSSNVKISERVLLSKR
jgi:murein DD-endopeptidase MepM/ murein hydrolase activator NlpD